ncbi:hypothetical protein [Caulobacter sp. BK020]|uniref:hypothetical protein n=1 Tax=Caulobacter sp. BK020 TaxID=2512117 RepID=UPI00104C0BEA|nr:hypothetical protein [Caulobacter sp. BK020]TCS14547.1 hypothetical protein EV278_107196 [Caulobacter sp. BK020]
MTKYYGSLVGTPKQAVPPALIPNVLADNKDWVLVRDTIELAASATDTVQAALLPWETVLNPYASDISFDDLGTGTTLSLGNVTYPTALISATDVATAAGTAKAMKSVDIANYFKPLWQTLGYATLAAAQAVSAQCELLFTINTAGATGTLTWQLVGIKR